jgi:hypothetical protein
VISGKVLRDFYVNAWRNIPELVTALQDEDAGKILAGQGIAKVAKSLQREVLDMAEGSILVAYQGFTKGNVGRNEITTHQIAAFIRALNSSEDANTQFGALMIDGTPDGQDQPVRYLEPDPNADAMDMPRFERVSTSELPFDVWKLSFTIPEHAG